MISDLKNFCELFYESTGIPLACFPSSGKEDTFPTVLSDTGLFQEILPVFSNSEKNPDYYISRSFGCFGKISSTDGKFVIFIGPVFSTPLSDSTLHRFMMEWAISPKYKDDLARFLSVIPCISINQFLSILACLHLCINDETISVKHHFEMEGLKNTDTLSVLHTSHLYESKEAEHYHNTYHYEQKMMQYIENGDVEKVKTLLLTSPGLSMGIVADNALRQAKNILIATISLATRSAIVGGMDIEQAYHLSDIYIQECEKMQDPAQISNLTYTTIVDFTNRVSQNKIPKGMSREIFDCIQFISNHVNKTIRVDDVARHIGKSRSYLSPKFKQELGFDISSFIMRCKLEEAKSLLTYSEKSLSEISSYLCFSSQSYFQNVFKKQYGITPKHYRDQNRRISCSSPFFRPG